MSIQISVEVCGSRELDLQTNTFHPSLTDPTLSIPHRNSQLQTSQQYYQAVDGSTLGFSETLTSSYKTRTNFLTTLPLKTWTTLISFPSLNRHRCPWASVSPPQANLDTCQILSSSQTYNANSPLPPLRPPCGCYHAGS